MVGTAQKPAGAKLRQTYFVTNGTSTANKIVVQALVQPGDIVLVDRNCHQSHHYGLMMAGAMVAHLDAYRLNKYCHPLLSRYMRCLTTADLIPAEYRPAGIDQPLRSGLPNMIKVWNTDESSRSSVAYLIEVLVTIARDLDTQISDSSPVERAAHERAVLRLTAPSAPLPDFSGFHPAFADEDRSCPSCAARTRRRCTASAPTSVTWSTPARRWKSPPRPAAAGSGK
jgi:arginine/lysine/ornithine decarboxylase